MKRNQSCSFLELFLRAASQFIADFHPTHTRVKLHNIADFLFSLLPLCLSVCDLSACGFVCFVFSFLKISIKNYVYAAWTARSKFIYLYNSNGGNS